MRKGILKSKENRDILSQYQAKIKKLHKMIKGCLEKPNDLGPFLAHFFEYGFSSSVVKWTKVLVREQTEYAVQQGLLKIRRGSLSKFRDALFLYAETKSDFYNYVKDKTHVYAYLGSSLVTDANPWATSMRGIIHNTHRKNVGHEVYAHLDCMQDRHRERLTSRFKGDGVLFNVHLDSVNSQLNGRLELAQRLDTFKSNLALKLTEVVKHQLPFKLIGVEFTSAHELEAMGTEAFITVNYTSRQTAEYPLTLHAGVSFLSQPQVHVDVPLCNYQAKGYEAFSEHFADVFNSESVCMIEDEKTGEQWARVLSQSPRKSASGILMVNDRELVSDTTNSKGIRLKMYKGNVLTGLGTALTPGYQACIEQAFKWAGDQPFRVWGIGVTPKAAVDACRNQSKSVDIRAGIMEAAEADVERGLKLLEQLKSGAYVTEALTYQQLLDTSTALSATINDLIANSSLNTASNLDTRSL
jgi:hypothetical protein